MEYVINLFNNYGYIVLFIALLLEIIAFPLPGEALMTYCGYVVYQGKMSWIISIVIATLGVCSGVTLSYYIGRTLGIAFFEKYGHYVHMDKKRMDTLSIWFEKYGNRLLLVAYFIPGVRHITGYFSGITEVSSKKFHINAYIGALIWTTVFISSGRILGANWEVYHGIFKRYFVIAGLSVAIIMILIYAYKFHKQKVIDFVVRALYKGLDIFHSLGKIKLFIAAASALFFVLLALIIGIIQDYLAHEFGKFDKVVKYLVMNTFNDKWTGFMKIAVQLSSFRIIIAALAITIMWIIIWGKEKAYEIRFLIAAFGGVLILASILEIIFHRTGPTGMVNTFPSRQSLMAVDVYGFSIYIMIKNNLHSWLNYVFIAIYLIGCLFIGASIVYLNLQYPSDVAAGYEFGFIGLSLCIILLEVYRILPQIESKKKDLI